MRRNRKIGIQTLLLRVFLPVVALAALLGAILVYNRINATILRQFDDRLIATSALTGALIDPADHDWLTFAITVATAVIALGTEFNPLWLFAIAGVLGIFTMS